MAFEGLNFSAKCKGQSEGGNIKDQVERACVIFVLLYFSVPSCSSLRRTLKSSLDSTYRDRSSKHKFHLRGFSLFFLKSAVVKNFREIQKIMRYIYIYHYHPIPRLTSLDIFATFYFKIKKLAARYI